MSRVLVIPDPHLKLEVIEHGLELADKKHADVIVMLGDYVDDWEAPKEEYTRMVDFLKKLLIRDPRVIPLYGNHELSYMGYPCSGHFAKIQKYLNHAFADDYRFLWAAAVDNVLYTHAGVTTTWLRANKVCIENDFRYKMGTLHRAEFLEDKINKAGIELMSHAGPARGGKSDAPSPLWADLTELIADPVDNLKQVVGHTPISEIQCIGTCWFTDVFSNGNDSDEYLFVDNGEPTVLNYNAVIGYE